MTAARRTEPSFPLLCLGFVVCGMVTVLPGPMLPIMAAKWGLRDVQSGGLIAAQFAASTAGAILSPMRLRRNLPAGYVLIAAGLLVLMAAEGARSGLGHVLGLAGFAAIGLGIGLSVTATNLLAGGSAHRLSIVNLFWGVGAVLCPGLIAGAEAGNHLRAMLLAIALVAASTFIAQLDLLRAGKSPAPARLFPAGSQLGITGWFALFLFLYVGVENAVGGWIATYAHRFSRMPVERASILVSVFWVALLAGRGCGALALKFFSGRAVLIFSLALSLLAVAVLLAASSGIGVLILVSAAGLGFGPVFPIGVANMLARLADHRITGWVFATCATGGAVLPWLTGLISTRSGSLRIGFAVPVTALVTILALALSEDAVLRRSPATLPGS